MIWSVIPVAFSLCQCERLLVGREGLEPSTFRSEVGRSIHWASIPQLFNIGIYRTIHQNFIIIFWIYFSLSLTAWINQTISLYKVLALLQVPYSSKKSSNLNSKLVPLFDYEITRRSLVIELFICSNKWTRGEASLGSAASTEAALQCFKHCIESMITPCRSRALLNLLKHGD